MIIFLTMPDLVYQLAIVNLSLDWIYQTQTVEKSKFSKAKGEGATLGAMGRSDIQSWISAAIRTIQTQNAENGGGRGPGLFGGENV